MSVLTKNTTANSRKDSMEELHPYYQDKERKNEELVKCWAWAVVFGLGIAVWCLAIKGVVCWFQGH